MSICLLQNTLESSSSSNTSASGVFFILPLLKYTTFDKGCPAEFFLCLTCSCTDTYRLKVHRR